MKEGCRDGHQYSLIEPRAHPSTFFRPTNLLVTAVFLNSYTAQHNPEPWYKPKYRDSVRATVWASESHNWLIGSRIATSDMYPNKVAFSVSHTLPMARNVVMIVKVKFYYLYVSTWVSLSNMLLLSL